MRLSFIDSFLNQITMYKLVLYSLVALALISILFGFLGVLSFSGLALVQTGLVVLVGVWISHIIFARLFKAAINTESYLITALILFLILAPIANTTDILVTFFIGVIATASKYLLAINKKHIFNPVAIALFLIGLFGFGNAIWWIGSAVLLPFVGVVGLLIVRKIRRFHLILSFLIVAIPTITFLNLLHGVELSQAVLIIFTSWPLVFFGTVMLTEPLTTPPTKRLYMIYGGLVGLLFSLQFEVGPIFSSPELALVIGNIYAYIVSPKSKLFLSFIKSEKISTNIYEFIFNKPKDFVFKSGQYLEWTLTHPKSDSRGVRRFFTIASSPTEEVLRLGVRIDPDSSSSYKKRLMSLEKNSQIVATQLAGDFTLPRDSSKKLVFIAGGIGITPFRSMTSYLLERQERRDIVLFYSASKEADFVYKDIFAKARNTLGLKTVYLATNDPSHKGEKGRLSEGVLKKNVPDFLSRSYYLSGPNSMVEGYRSMLLSAGVKRADIITDYFPGF